MTGTREYDIILQGATGFTGRLVAEYLLANYGVDRSFRWALAGRNASKLEAVRDEIGGAGLPIILGDAQDAESMRALAGRTKVVCTTVGPYAKYGSELVAACAEQGTDYCDLTGEVHWMQRMIEMHEAAAVASGARIVPTCGFDCIPSDLGVYWLQREMRERYGVSSPRIRMGVVGFKGGASGGTIASMLNMVEEAAANPEIMKQMNDPYALNPKDQRVGPDGGDVFRPVHDDLFGQWTAPFVMAAVNTKVVRRSNALLQRRYGANFRYEERVLTGSGAGGFAKAAGATAALGGGMAAMSLGPLRRRIAGRLPQPGDGPSKRRRESGYWELRMIAEHPDDPARNLDACLRGDMDPGYGSTSKMLGESAVCLACDSATTEGGFLTPATAMGDALLVRLWKNAGVEFSIT